MLTLIRVKFGHQIVGGGSVGKVYRKNITNHHLLLSERKERVEDGEWIVDQGQRTEGRKQWSE